MNKQSNCRWFEMSWRSCDVSAINAKNDSMGFYRHVFQLIIPGPKYDVMGECCFRIIASTAPGSCCVENAELMAYPEKTANIHTVNYLADDRKSFHLCILKSADRVTVVSVSLRVAEIKCITREWFVMFTNLIIVKLEPLPSFKYCINFYCEARYLTVQHRLGLKQNGCHSSQHHLL